MTDDILPPVQDPAQISFLEAPAPAPAPTQDIGAQLFAKPGPWYEGRMLALDFETTGTDPHEARIVTAALLLVDAAGEVIDSLTLLVDPGIEIPAEASAVHGITTERARADGIPEDRAVSRIFGCLANWWRDGRPLVIYNARYDWTLLRAAAHRHGIAVPDYVDARDTPILDPLLADQTVEPYRKGGRKLSTVAARWSVQLTDAHSAGADALAAVGVARTIARMWPRLRTLRPDELIRAQQDWFAAFRSGRNRYYERTGAATRISAGWPLAERETVGEE